MALPSSYGEESPEALRRRAEVLLDEMMLGGVDTASAGPHTGNGATHWPQSAEVESEYDGAGYGSNGVSSGVRAYDANVFDQPLAEPSAASAPDAKQSAASPPVTSPRDGRLVSAEERYAQFAGARPTAPQQPQAPAEQPQRPPSADPATTLDTQAAALPLSEPAEDHWRPASSAVRRQSPSLASTMSVGLRGANRSNLLPRNHELDANSTQQEINDLLRAVGAGFPAGNEAVERSRHLLNKAQTLLQSDPTRTAEVDYYLQQVRRIVQRTQQTQQWSSLYRQRLNVYLWAWLTLSVLIASAAVLYAAPLADWLNGVVNLPDWWLVVQQAPVLLASAFAGSLGASLSALLHMQRHGRREFGYFDRKYGLRGLLLPLLGLFLSLLLVLLWCGVYLMASLDPVLHLWAILAPAAVALLVGFAQQWLYGAR